MTQSSLHLKEKMDTTGSDILVRIDNISVCYDDLGKGDVIIFIHGFPFDKSSWQPQIDKFKNSHRVIAYDQRGFGKSTGGADLSITQFADDLIAILDVLQIKKVIGCGLSMGGYTLLNAVNRFPERFSSIILCDTQCIADSPEGKEKRFNTINSINEKGLNEYADTSVKNLFSPDTLESNHLLTNRIKKLILNTRVETVTSTLKALAERNETCSVLESIIIPALIICGEEDKITPVAQAEFLASNIKGAKLKIIDGAAHLSNLEQPEKFNVLVEEFLQSI